MSIRSVAVYCARRQLGHPFFPALLQGLRRHGLDVVVQHDGSVGWADVAACWGWRNGLKLAGEIGPHRVLVLERGYMTDRLGRDRFTWTSLGWGGLNGHAVFPASDDGGARFRAHYDPVPPPAPKGDDVVVMGQVLGDASIAGVQLGDWYRQTVAELRTIYGRPVVFRPHPAHRGEPWRHGATEIQGTLAEALDRAHVVVAYNSNSLTDAVMAGVPTIAGDAGAMAWPVAGRLRDFAVAGTANLERWGNRMAWTQWLPEELASGAAWEAVAAARYGRAWHQTWTEERACA